MNRKIWYYIFYIIVFAGLSQIPRIFFDDTTSIHYWIISRVVFWGGAIVFSVLWMRLLKEKILKIWEALDYRLYIFINVFIICVFLLEIVIGFVID